MCVYTFRVRRIIDLTNCRSIAFLTPVAATDSGSLSIFGGIIL